MEKLNAIFMATFQRCLCVVGLTKEKENMEQRGSRRKKQKTKEHAERKQLEATQAARKKGIQEKEGKLWLYTDDLGDAGKATDFNVGFGQAGKLNWGLQLRTYFYNTLSTGWGNNTHPHVCKPI